MNEAFRDVYEKEQRLRNFMDERGFDAVVLTLRSNFSWLTGGGDNHVLLNSEYGCAPVLVTKKAKYLIAHPMDGPRIMREEIAGQGFEMVLHPWYEPDRKEVIRRIAGRGRLACDAPFFGADNVAEDIMRLHYPFTVTEVERCRVLALESALCFGDVANSVRSGEQELDVAARLISAFASRHIQTEVVIVAADDRIRDYRHPIPTSRRIRKTALLHAVAQKWGLHCNVSRMVALGGIPEDLVRIHRAACYIEAVNAAHSRPGVLFQDLLAKVKEAYAEVGFPEEWKAHFVGGPTGYVILHSAAMLDPSWNVSEHQPMGHLATIAGTKVEELIMVTPEGTSVLSNSKGWPLLNFEINGQYIELPDVLVI
ncbi:MAG: aminopeptidase P family N-terminal domain-containing protein [Firmicutes bacterium]|jgi:Xaa-Pro aminopeptidase|nr:aminopeptidase P family N-terminal domain-containing protein [Bacillota bacterium]MDH7495710.1 M24 family metallopeptidase [Bacillota bacterium]